MATQVYWVALGRGSSKYKPNYAQSLIDSEYWAEHAMKANETPVLIRVEFNPKTGGVSATVEKNSPFVPFTHD